MPDELMGMAADAARETASEICEETRGRWATPEELVAMAHEDAEVHHARGDGICTYGNMTYDEAYRARRAELAAKPITAASIIYAEDVMRRLLELPEVILACEEMMIRAEGDVAAEKAALVTREDELLIGGAHLIDGKNAETRAAQLRQATSRERGHIAEAEDYARRVRADYHRAVNEFSALKIVARMLEGRE